MKQNLEEIAATIPNYKMVDGKYYIKTTKLGKGNFADTHLATLKENEKIVFACKLIAKQNIIEKLKKSNNPESRKEYIINSLKIEVSLWKYRIFTRSRLQMDHPNIVKFIDFSETPNNIYFFLEYCNGGDLDMLIKDKGKLNEQETVDIFLQIAEGCSYLYDKSVFHRDLKPENILIHNGTAKLADFGFAKVIEEDKKDVAAHGTSVGTPYYMAPQILAGEDYCIKCDVWSLGVILYQMLFGVLPWKDTNSIMLLLNATLEFCLLTEIIKEYYIDYHLFAVGIIKSIFKNQVYQQLENSISKYKSSQLRDERLNYSIKYIYELLENAVKERRRSYQYQGSV